MISTRMRPLKINKIENQTNKIPLNIKKENLSKNKTMDSNNNKRIKKSIFKRNKTKNKLSNSINSIQIHPLSGSMTSSISMKKSIKDTSTNFKQLNSLREKILSSIEENKKIIPTNSISKIYKIKSTQRIKVKKTKNNISLKKINQKSNQLNINYNNHINIYHNDINHISNIKINNNIYNNTKYNNINNNINSNNNNNLTPSNNKQTNYSSFEISEKKIQNKIHPINLEKKFNNIQYEYNEEESNFLNYELGNTKNFSILNDYSINFTNFSIFSPQENKFDEKEINIEDLYNNYQNNLIDNNQEESIYYVDTKEMKEGENIHKVYSMAFSSKNFVNLEK